jgi:hypothetical protein
MSCELSVVYWNDPARSYLFRGQCIVVRIPVTVHSF